MAKHGKKSDVTATQGNPVIRAINASKVAPDPDRLAKDIEICEKGWNNTAEGQEYLATNGKSGKGKHAKS